MIEGPVCVVAPVHAKVRPGRVPRFSTRMTSGVVLAGGHRPFGLHRPPRTLTEVTKRAEPLVGGHRRCCRFRPLFIPEVTRLISLKLVAGERLEECGMW